MAVKVTESFMHVKFYSLKRLKNVENFENVVLKLKTVDFSTLICACNFTIKIAYGDDSSPKSTLI